MKRSYTSLFIIIFCSSFFLYGQKIPSAITYAPWNHGRLGDHLVLYVKIKWLAFQHNLPLLHKPFKYSDQFEFHYKETLYDPSDLKKYKKTMIINQEPETIDPQASILYEVDYWFQIDRNWRKIALENEEFMREIRRMIKPHFPITNLILPDKIKTIAVHIRKGTGYDRPLLSQQIYKKPNQQYSDQRWPTKFPPDQYYIDQIINLSKIFNDEPLYVHIFTDDPNPEKIAELYKKKISKPNLIFNYRKEDNHHSKNLIDDLFAMSQFDCLIRGSSRFSIMAEIIGKHKMVISPKKYIWQGNKLIITEVKIRENHLAN